MFTRTQFVPNLDEPEFFAALPTTPAVFVLRPHTAPQDETPANETPANETPSDETRRAAAEPYISKTANLRRRLQRLLAPAEGRRLSLRTRVASVEFHPVGGDFEAAFTLYRILRAEFPAKYTSRLHLRPAPLVQLLLENPYPRVTVTTRIRSLRSASAYFGPFATRAEAEQYANDSLDFFLLRRCTEELSPDPSFPGCVYSEMKMCLAPCFRGCTDERYAEESARVARYFESAGHSLHVELSRARDEASERLEFEAAAAAHSRLEKLKSVQSRVAEIVHRIDRLNGLLLQPSSLPGHISLFRIAAGMLYGPIPFDLTARAVTATSSKPSDPTQLTNLQAADAQSTAAPPQKTHAPTQSMEARINELLRTVIPTPPRSAQEWMEHLSILKRWYYRTNKVGEIFFEDEHGTLPMRRVVRAVGRVLKGEKPAADLSETAGDYWIFRSKEAGL